MYNYHNLMHLFLTACKFCSFSWPPQYQTCSYAFAMVNGTVFTSEEFNSFTKQNGIRHVTSAPYHPTSNGLAERAVQTFKSFMEKSTSGSIEARVSRFLLQYRITPQTTTGISPAEMIMGRRPRSRLDLLIPNMATKMQHKQQSQKQYHD